mmetsp:Transcript_35267/g.85653  ORF Transcript_35267/g.85653 Transcript_35267/m.85653 type:complete len:97 (+) Transcript_35267:692-982(+)
MLSSSTRTWTRHTRSSRRSCGYDAALQVVEMSMWARGVLVTPRPLRFVSYFLLHLLIEHVSSSFAFINDGMGKARFIGTYFIQHVPQWTFEEPSFI